MIVALATLLLCQLAGEAITRTLSLPAPGPVIGAALLFGLLALRERCAKFLPREINDGSLDTAAKFLLANLSLLFVPAGVGVLQNLAVFRLHGVALAAALIVSTVLALVVTALVFIAASRLARDDAADADGAPGP